MKKPFINAVIAIMCLSASFAFAQTQAPEATPDPTPTPIIVSDGGVYVNMEPRSLTAFLREGDCMFTVNPNTFQTTLYVDTRFTSQIFAVFAATITYDPAIIVPNMTIGEYGVEQGSDEFVMVINGTTPGIINIAGFDTTGKAPEKIDLLHFNWHAVAPGACTINIQINEITDLYGMLILPLMVSPSTVTVKRAAFGDVDVNGALTIIDALRIAQYYVGAASDPSIPCLGDFTRDGAVNIIDALQVAKCYVGLIDCPM